MTIEDIIWLWNELRKTGYLLTAEEALEKKGAIETRQTRKLYLLTGSVLLPVPERESVWGFGPLFLEHRVQTVSSSFPSCHPIYLLFLHPSQIYLLSLLLPLKTAIIIIIFTFSQREKKFVSPCQQTILHTSRIVTFF